MDCVSNILTGRVIRVIVVVVVLVMWTINGAIMLHILLDVQLDHWIACPGAECMF